MPILGVVASSTRQGQTPVDNGAMFPIAMVNVGSAGAANVTFNSIPADYKHLQLRYLGRAGRANGYTGYFWLQINTVYGSRYHTLFGNGFANTSLSGVPAQDTGAYIQAPGTAAAANIFGVGVIDFLDYTSTNKNKTVRIFSGTNLNGTGIVNLGSYLYGTTSAITSITIGSVDSDGGALIQNYSQFALYGIKG